MRFFDALSLGGTCSVFATGLGMSLGSTTVAMTGALVGWLCFLLAFLSMTDLGTAALKASYPAEETTPHEPPGDSTGH